MILRVGSWHLKGLNFLSYTRRWIRASGLSPGVSLTFPLRASISTTTNKIKTKGAWLTTEEAVHGWPFLSFFTKRWRISVTFTVFPPNLSATVDSLRSGCPGEGRVLPFLFFTVEALACLSPCPPSHPVPTITAFSPKQGRLFRPSLAVLSSWLLTLLPVCREGFCVVLATCFSPRMNDGWLARATALPSRVLGPLLPSFSSDCLRNPRDPASRVAPSHH